MALGKDFPDMQINVIHTRVHAHEGCCGCVIVHEADNGTDVLFVCNECGKEMGRAPIPSEAG